MLTAINWENVLNEIIKWITSEGLKLLIGVFALFVAFKIINIFARGVKKGLDKRHSEKTIAYVVHQVIRKGLKIVAFLLFLGYVGFDTAGIGAIISSVGIAIGLALQGSLGNFAGGIVIILMRPFKLGDFIEAQDNLGTVDKIGAFYTTLITPDNRVVMVPNGALANGNIINYSTNTTRRLEQKFPISHQEDFERAKKCIEDVLLTNKNILSEPKPFLNVAEYNDYAIIIVVRVWVNTDVFWPTHFWMLESIKHGLEQAGIDLPYRQLDVHLNEPKP